MNKDNDRLADFCKALAHPARLEILRHLLLEDRCICGRIVEVLPLAQSTVSQHLKILKEAGLIHGEVEGPKTCYCVNKEFCRQNLDQLQTLFDLSGANHAS